MESLKLIVRKSELVRALRVLGTNRRRRFSSVVPIWLAYESEIGELRLREERGGVTAGLPAIGTWPVVGATVNLFPLRRAAETAATEDVELIAVDESMKLYWFLPHRVTCRCRSSTLVLPVSFRRPAHGRIVTRICRFSFGPPGAPAERRVSRGRSVEPGFRQRWPGQREEQPAEVVDRTVRAPSMHGAKNVLAPPSIVQ